MVKKGQFKKGAVIKTKYFPGVRPGIDRQLIGNYHKGIRVGPIPSKRPEMKWSAAYQLDDDLTVTYANNIDMVDVGSNYIRS